MTEGSDSQRTAVGRRATRQAYEASVSFRAGNRRADVKVLNISKLGARISGVFLVSVGDRFFLKIRNLEAIEAHVVWVENFEFGCEFARPLNEIVLEAVTDGKI